MAGFGLKHLVVAPVTAETASSITYGAGAVCEHARRAAITYNWDEAKLYGDDKLAEYIKSLTDADIELETTELTAETAVLMGLEVEKTASATSTPAVYTMVTDQSESVGVGYVAVDFINGEKVYTGVWVHKVTFTRNNEERSTKEDTVNWQTPTISGKCWPLALGTNGENQIRDFSEFETETAAIAWVNSKAGIT
jgi:phi13 family phage major tail protein